ncbi:retrovirus-related pol polyprotein from transposon TNT 1-94 [Tanacetum coccineum]
MEATIDQCSVDKNVFEIQIKQLRIDNDQLLNQIMSQEIVHIVVNYVDILDVKKSCMNNCSGCLELEIELFKKKDFIEKAAYNKLVKSYSNLEKHCISMELATQLNQDIFQRENSAQSQEKDTIIRKLKERIKSLSGKDSVENVKKYIDKIETINIELEHSVAKLLSENENLRKEREHLKSIYKDQFDSIRKTRVQSKEHYDSLIAQIYAKSLENSDLNAQLQEKVFANAALKNELRKLKGKIFAKPVTSSNNIPKQTDSLKTKDSNKPLLTSTGVIPITKLRNLRSIEVGSTLMLASIDNDPLVYPTIEENRQTRPKKYSELTEAQQLQDDCDVQATNIILHGLPPDVYALINHQEAANLYTTNYDQSYAYLSQHERHANEVRIIRERYPDSLAFVANSPTLYNPSQSPQHLVNLQQYLVSPPPFISPSMTPQSQAEFSQLDSDLAVRNRGIGTTSKGNVAVGPLRVVKCYNCQGEGHMAR